MIYWEFEQASVAACPTGQWGTGKIEVGETEAGADEAVAFLAEIASRPLIEGRAV